MLLSSTLNDGIVQTLNRLTGGTVNTYSFKAKMADINDALDWYVQLAFMAGLGWEFDDSSETSPPIDTQNIVSGTNRYKFSSFTEKIINLVKLEVLDSSGSGIELIPETLDSIGVLYPGNTSGRLYGNSGSTFQDLYINASSGTPTHYIKYGDFVYLRPKPDYNSTSGLKAYFNRAATKFEFVTCTPEADDDTITATSHGLAANDTVIFEVDSSGTISGGLTADTQYYVISSGLTANVFKVATTQGGSAVNISSDGSGVQFLKTSAEPGIPSIHHRALCRKAAISYLSLPSNANSTGRLPALIQESLRDERMIESYFASRDKDIRKRFIPMRSETR